MSTKELLLLGFLSFAAISALSMYGQTAAVEAQIIVDEGQLACVKEPGNSLPQIVLVDAGVKEQIDSGELKPLPVQACSASMNR
jgi:hypothetical protein